MRSRKLWPAMALLAASVLWPGVATSYDPYLVVPPEKVVHASPSYRYAQMTGAQALAELRRRGILFQRVHKKIGRVHTPIRLTGRLHGVYFHSSLPEEQRAETVFEICDARFALTLDDFAAILQRHGIVEVVHYTMYRPAVGQTRAQVSETKEQTAYAQAEARATNEQCESAGQVDGEQVFAKKVRGREKKRAEAKRAGVSRGQEASGEPRQGAGTKRAKGGGKASSSKKRTSTAGSKRAGSRRHGKVRHKSIKHGVKPHRSRHPDGLAIDVGALRKKDGTWLRVSHDFHGVIGAQTCGGRAKAPSDPKGKELWAIVCESFDEKVFTYVLTPNFNLAHQDHFHMEIKPGMRWFLYH